MGINRNTITKGGDATVVVPLSTCSQPVDLQAVENLTCSFYTEDGGQAIERELADFVIDGDNGITLLRWQELDQLPDGVIKYTVEYDYEGEHIKFDQYTSYYLKTAPGYIPMDFVSRDEVDAVVASAITSSAGTEVIEHVIEEAGYVDEDFVNSAITQAVSGLASEDYVESAMTQAVSGLASEEYVESAMTQAVSGLASETYVNNAIADIDDYCIYLLSSNGEYDGIPASEVNRLIDYANGRVDDVSKIRVFIPMNGGLHQEFHITNIGTYDGVESAFVYGVFVQDGDIFYDRRKVSVFTGKLKRNTDVGHQQPDGGLMESVIMASSDEIMSTTYTYYLFDKDDTDVRRAIIAKAYEMYLATEGSDRYKGIRVIYNGRVYGIELFSEGEGEPNVICTSLEASYMHDTTVYIGVITFDGTMSNDMWSERIETVDMSVFATTAQTAEFVTSAQTESIVQSAITASNLVYAVSNTNKIWAGSREAYSAQTIDNTTLYFITN